MTTAERATELLRARGIPCDFEPFDSTISLEDDFGWWIWGTNNETWCADILHDPAVGNYFGCATTDVPSDTTDPQAIADAIIHAVNGGVGVEIWKD